MIIQKIIYSINGVFPAIIGSQQCKDCKMAGSTSEFSCLIHATLQSLPNQKRNMKSTSSGQRWLRSSTACKYTWKIETMRPSSDRIDKSGTLPATGLLPEGIFSISPWNTMIRPGNLLRAANRLPAVYGNPAMMLLRLYIPSQVHRQTS